jgi:hypothetical protein
MRREKRKRIENIGKKRKKEEEERKKNKYRDEGDNRE